MWCETPLFFWNNWVFCYGDEENGHRACTSEHLTTANQSEIRKAYLVSVGYMNNQELCILLDSILALLETDNAEKAKEVIKNSIEILKILVHLRLDGLLLFDTKEDVKL